MTPRPRVKSAGSANPRADLSKSREVDPDASLITDYQLITDIRVSVEVSTFPYLMELLVDSVLRTLHTNYIAPSQPLY